jgi:hypothetical protein
LVAVTPGIGVIMMAPVSVCHQAWTMGLEVVILLDAGTERNRP